MRNKVLIADDDESILWVLKQMLGDKKIEIAEARDGKSALEMLKGEDFSLAVMDIRMPEKDGLDVLKEVKEAGSQTPVIIMTAQGTMNNAIEAMKLGAFDYITKPFDISEMEIIVDRALDYKKLKVHLALQKSRRPEIFSVQTTFKGTTWPAQDVYKII